MQYLPRIAKSAVAASMALVAAAALAAPERGYQVIDLGRYTDDGTGVVAFDLNNLGQVGGTVDGRTFLWSASSGFRYLDALGTGARVAAINDRGQLVGSVGGAGFLTSGGSAQTVQRLDFTPTGLNNLGTVLGLGAQGVQTYRDGVVTTYGHRDGYALNDRGQFVGSTVLAEDNRPVALLYDPVRGLQPIDPGDGGDLGHGTSINRHGDFIGMRSVSSEFAYRYSAATGVRRLAADIGFGSFEGGINDNGLVVGAFSTPEYEFPWTRGFMSVAADQPTVDLNTLLTRVSARDWTIVGGNDINNAGQILAGALGADGRLHRVLLTPSAGGVCIPGKGLLAALGRR